MRRAYTFSGRSGMASAGTGRPMDEDERHELRVTGRQEADEARVDPAGRCTGRPRPSSPSASRPDRRRRSGRCRSCRPRCSRGPGARGDAVVDRVREQLDHRLGRLLPHDPLRRGLLGLVDRAVRIGPAVDDVRRHEQPAVGERGVAGRELDRGQAQALAERVLRRGEVARGIRAVGIPDHAARLAGQLDPGRRAEPEAQERLVQLARHPA